MAKTDKADEAPKKHVLSIYTADGKIGGHDLMAINKQAQEAQAPAKARHKSVMKRITDMLGVELKRTIRG